MRRHPYRTHKLLVVKTVSQVSDSTCCSPSSPASIVLHQAGVYLAEACSSLLPGLSCLAPRPRPSHDIDPQSSSSRGPPPRTQHGSFTRASVVLQGKGSIGAMQFAGRTIARVPATARSRLERRKSSWLRPRRWASSTTLDRPSRWTRGT